VIGFNIANLAPLPRDLDQVVVAVTSITNEFGDPLALPNDGHSSIPEISKNRVSSFIPHIAISTIPDYVFPECDQQKYGIYQELVNNQLLAVPEQTTLVGTQFIKYSLDIMDAAVLATTCTTEVASNLGTEEAFLVLENQTACLEVTGTPDCFMLFALYIQHNIRNFHRRSECEWVCHSRLRGILLRRTFFFFK